MSTRTVIPSRPARTKTPFPSMSFELISMKYLFFSFLVKHRLNPINLLSLKTWSPISLIPTSATVNWIWRQQQRTASMPPWPLDNSSPLCDLPKLMLRSISEIKWMLKMSKRLYVWCTWARLLSSILKTARTREKTSFPLFTRLFENISWWMKLPPQRWKSSRHMLFERDIPPYNYRYDDTIFDDDDFVELYWTLRKY